MHDCQAACQALQMLKRACPAVGPSKLGPANRGARRLAATRRRQTINRGVEEAIRQAQAAGSHDPRAHKLGELKRGQAPERALLYARMGSHMPIASVGIPIQRYACSRPIYRAVVAASIHRSRDEAPARREPRSGTPPPSSYRWRPGLGMGSVQSPDLVT